MLNSQLHDEKTFYKAFLRDLEACKEEAIIESPFITTDRMKILRPTFERLVRIGVQVLLCVGNHHRKLAILDRRVLWEGSSS